MVVINSNDNRSGKRGLCAKFVLGDGIVERVNDEAIGDLDTARRRAESILLDRGHKKFLVEVETVPIDVQIGDIVRIYAPSRRIPRVIGSDRFVVVGVLHSFKIDAVTTKIKAVRYDL